MTKLMMQIHNKQCEIVYREPYQSEIDSAAGVTDLRAQLRQLQAQLHDAERALRYQVEIKNSMRASLAALTQQRDALLAAAKMASPVFNNPEESCFADYVKAAKATDDAIAACEPKQVTP